MSPPLESDSLLEDTVPQNMDQGQDVARTKSGSCDLDGGSSPSVGEDGEPFSESSSEATGAASGSRRQGSPPHTSTAATTATNSDASGEEEDNASTRGSTGEAGAGARLDLQDDEVGSSLTGVCRVDSIDLGYFFFLFANLSSKNAPMV